MRKRHGGFPMKVVVKPGQEEGVDWVGRGRGVMVAMGNVYERVVSQQEGL